MRLAAILAADAAEYSRLMSADERATVAALDAARAVFRKHIAGEQGRVVDTAGDSVLAVFETAGGAAAAALAIQDALVALAAAEREDRRMRFRIGVHLGDVIEKADGTVYGDGVNIAARLAALADPGGIIVSDAVRSAVRGKAGVAFEDRGEQAVKNIADPVRAYQLHAAAPAAPGAGARESGPALPDKPSVVVLPFTNMSGDPEQEYFADGITEDLITDLSQVSGLFVIARNSSFVFKNRAVDVRDAARRFGVRHVLEGSVRKAGARVRITAQLVDAQTGGHLWAERFDRDLADIFAVQDEVTRRIVDALKVKLTANERLRREHRAQVDPDAYDCVVRARNCLIRFTPEAAVESRAMLDRALQIQPGLAIAHALLAMTLGTEYANGWNGDAEPHLRQAMSDAQKACEADPNEPRAWQALAMIHLWRKEHEPAMRAAERAIELDTNFSGGYLSLGQVLDFSGQYEQAIEAFERALRLDPEFDMILNLLGRAQLGLGRHADAERSFRRRLVLNPASDMTRVYLASLYGSTGRGAEARQLWTELLEINPRFSVERLRRILPYKDPAWFERIAAGLRAAGVVR